MKENFTEQESLELITEMINQAKNSFDEKSGQSMMIFGYGVSIISLLNFILLYTLPQPVMAFHVWWLMFVVCLVNTVVSKNRKRVSIVKNHMAKVITAAWDGYLYSAVLLGLMIVTYCVAFNNYIFTVIITPVILILMGGAMYVTAIASQSKLYKQGAFVFWGSAIATIALIAFGMPNFQFIILALASVLAFVIPAHRSSKK